MLHAHKMPLRGATTFLIRTTTLRQIDITIRRDVQRLSLFGVQKSPCSKSRRGFALQKLFYASLFVAIVVNDTRSNRLDAQQVAVVDVVAEIVATIGTATEGQ